MFSSYFKNMVLTSCFTQEEMVVIRIFTSLDDTHVSYDALMWMSGGMKGWPSTITKMIRQHNCKANCY
jgi:hypothetical protein